jgi:Ca-activated chloride channel homolog
MLMHSSRQLVVTLAISSLSPLLSPLPAAAQDLPVFRAAADVVVVPVTVTDRSGRFVRGLTADQFEIRDGGDRRVITQFSAERVPVSLAVLLDISGSMASDPKAALTDDARWADTRRALELLVKRFDPRDEVLFAVFSEKVALAAPWTQEHRRILSAFDSIRPGGTTGLYRAIKLIAPAFQMARHQRKALLLISDGLDNTTWNVPPAGPITQPVRNREGQIVNDGGHSAAEARHLQQDMAAKVAASESKAAVTGSNAVLYAIGMGTRKGAPVDVDALGNLTSGSGGYVEPLQAPSQIAEAVARICDDLQSQYVLAFEPVHADGQFHSISVTVKDKQLRVRARAGYVATQK